MQAYQQILQTPTNYDIWQFKLTETIIDRKIGHHLLSTEHLAALMKMVRTRMDKMLIDHSSYLKRYLFSSNINYLQEVSDLQTLKEIATVVTYFDLPINVMNLIDLRGASGQPNILCLLVELKKLKFDLKSIQCISDIMLTNV